MENSGGQGARFDGVDVSSIKTEFPIPDKGQLSDQVETNSLQLRLESIHGGDELRRNFGHFLGNAVDMVSSTHLERIKV